MSKEISSVDIEEDWLIFEATHDHGLVLVPSRESKIDCYPDADFTGMYRYKNSSNPSCVKSRPVFVITVSNCPVLWQFKLHTETTMEAAVVVLACSCRDHFPIMNIVSLSRTKVD